MLLSRRPCRTPREGTEVSRRVLIKRCGLSEPTSNSHTRAGGVESRRSGGLRGDLRGCTRLNRSALPSTHTYEARMYGPKNSSSLPLRPRETGLALGSTVASTSPRVGPDRSIFWRPRRSAHTLGPRGCRGSKQPLGSRAARRAGPDALAASVVFRELAARERRAQPRPRNLISAREPLATGLKQEHEQHHGQQQQRERASSRG